MSQIITTLETGPAALAISRVEEARALLAESRSLDDILEFRNRALAAEFFNRRRRDAHAAQADAWEIAQLAARRFGEVCRELPQATAGRPKKRRGPEDEHAAEVGAGEIGTDPEPISKSAELKRLGVSKGEAARLERLASMPDAEWSARLERGKREIVQKRNLKIGSTSAATDYDGDSCGTPEKYIASVRKVLGSIEFDPFSNARAQNIVRADHFCTKDDSGIAASWQAVLGPNGTVYWNPPYSRGLIKSCVAKFLHEYVEQKSVRASIGLVNSSTDTGWFQSLIEACTLLCHTDHRIGFLIGDKPVSDNRYTQTFFYFGADAGAFYTEFRQYGQVLAPVRGLT